jgi:arylsulfatase A-like enzyme
MAEMSISTTADTKKTDPTAAAAAGKKPNILLIMTDQQRFDSLGCYGSKWTISPNLDRLASEGTLFENCYTNNPICTPARSSLMTGKELPGHGVYRLHDKLPGNEVLFTERLRGLGYRTALFGKLHVSGRIEEALRRHPKDGFDVYEYCCEPALDLDSPFNGYGRWLREKHPDYYQKLKTSGRDRGHDPAEATMNRWAADGAIGFMEEQAQRGNGQPFFCMMSVFDPHNPYGNYPLEMERFVDRPLIPVPVGPEDGGKIPYAFDAEREHSYLGSVAAFTPEAIREMRAGYAAMIAAVDLEAGRVLEALERAGLKENTLVVFTSDHGDMLGDHGTVVKGAMLHDPCVRVPLIARLPGAFDGGRRSASLVQLHDLAATFLSAAGAPLDDLAAWMPDSRNIAADHSGRIDAFRDFAVCAYRNSGIDDTGRYWDPAIDTTMIRRGRWKLHAYHPVAGKQESPVYKLFDLQADPTEERDLAGSAEHARTLAVLKEDLIAWLLAAELRQGSRGGAAVPKKDQLIKNALEFNDGARQ